MYLSGVEGLGKGQGETLFDTGRAKLWSQFVALHANLDPVIAANQVTGAQLAGGIATVIGLISQHKALYAQAASAGASKSWLDPRFADYEKPFEDYLAKLQAMSAAAGVTAPATGGPVITLPVETSPGTVTLIQGSAPANMPTSANVSAPGSPGGGVFSDIFGPPATPGAPTGGLLTEMEPYLPWIAAGLAVAYFLKRK